MGSARCTDVMVHSSVCYHKEHDLPTVVEPRRLHKNEQAACSAAIPRFHGISSLASMGINLWSCTVCFPGCPTHSRKVVFVICVV